MNFKDRYGPLDRLLHDIAFRAGYAQRALADIEEIIYKERLKDVRVDQPVFITALPRSGTTILLQLLYDSGYFASHTYRDMPFVLCPLVWSRFSTRFTVDHTSRERSHGDGLEVSADSPEAFEEMIWKSYWPNHYKSDRIVPWTSVERNVEFEKFLEGNMRKVVTLRQGKSTHPMHYVSKNNLNIARLSSLPGPLRRGVFLIPFRDPVQHAASMLRQHERFTRLHEQDDFDRRYMEAIGHHEFGKGLRPVDFGAWLEKAPPSNQLAFWLQYWIAAYRHVLEHVSTSVRLICYADLTTRPKSELARIAAAVGVGDEELTSQAGRVRPPRSHDVLQMDIPVPVREEAEDLYHCLEQLARD